MARINEPPVGKLIYSPDMHVIKGIVMFNHGFVGRGLNSLSFEEDQKLRDNLDAAIEHFGKFGFDVSSVVYKDYKDDEQPNDMERDQSEALNEFLTKKFHEYAEEKDKNEGQ